MKIEVMFKTPNAIEQAIANENFSYDWQRDEVIATAKKFVRFGEYIIIELDTETQKCVVKEI
jgi:hypothetical protein